MSVSKPNASNCRPTSAVANAETLGVAEDAVEGLVANLRDERDALAEPEDVAAGSAVESLWATPAEDSP